MTTVEWNDKRLDEEFSRASVRSGQIEMDMKTIRYEIGSKVNWKHFTWIISTVIGVQIIVMGAIWAQVSDNGAEISDVNKNVSNISGILRGAEITD